MATGPWSTQARMLKDAVDGWRTKQWQHRSLDYLVALAAESARRLDEYAAAIQQVLVGEKDVAVFACGSNGRLEAWGESDIDVLMIVRTLPSDPSGVGHNCELLRKVCACLSKVNTKAFDPEKLQKMHDILTDKYFEHVNSDVFRRWLPLSFLCENQFDESDSLVRQIRRVSLLLESQPLTENDFTKSVRHKILEGVYRMAANTHIRAESWSLFSRDILRFVHSSHLFHHHKTVVMGKSAEPRFAKLVVTRKMLGAATLLLLRYVYRGNLSTDFLTDPPTLKLLRIIADDLTPGCTSWPSSLHLFSCYGSALENIHHLPHGSFEESSSSDSRITIVRSDIGADAFQIDQHIKDILTITIDRSGLEISHLLRDLM